MPDHVGKDNDDPDERQALVFCYGYIRGLIQGLGGSPETISHAQDPDQLVGVGVGKAHGAVGLHVPQS